MNGYVKAGDVELWVDQRGDGPDVVLLAGLSDPAEAWEFQLGGLADHYRVTAFDNRGTGRTPLPAEKLTVPMMVNDVAELMHALDIPSAHVSASRAAPSSRRSSRYATPSSSAVWCWSERSPNSMRTEGR